MTAQELLAIARAEKPGIEYTTNRKGDAIAARRNKNEPWQMVAGLLTTGEWVEVGNLIIDGAPVVNDWIA